MAVSENAFESTNSTYFIRNFVKYVSDTNLTCAKTREIAFHIQWELKFVDKKGYPLPLLYYRTIVDMYERMKTQPSESIVGDEEKKVFLRAMEHCMRHLFIPVEEELKIHRKLFAHSLLTIMDIPLHIWNSWKYIIV